MVINRFLKIFNQGFLHWFTQRVSACFLIVIFLLVVVLNNFFLVFGAFLLVVIHFESGIHTIFSDYMHDTKSKLIVNMIIDISMISFIKAFFSFLIFFS
jgi:succinate dehydrogenase hydrophobic anchor subunit